MALQIVRNYITKMEVDAIVNAANKTLLGGRAIHRAAGKKLLFACIKLCGCRTGEAKITSGYNLPAKYVIHTVGPVWHGGRNQEEYNLRKCYINSLLLAKQNGIKSIAFPLISSGVYGYPKDKALKVARGVIEHFLEDNEMEVYLVIFNPDAVTISNALFDEVQQFIDDNYVGKHVKNIYSIRKIEEYVEEKPVSNVRYSLDVPTYSSDNVFDFDRIIKNTIDESFAEMLLRKIDENGMKDSECYKKANIDRTLFSKIRTNKNYKPSKSTVIAFAIALEMDIDETNELLLKAGYALSHSSIFDIIIEYFIIKKNYNIFEINEVLFSYDQAILGSK